jgi:predicted amidohydrolase YtcJ
MHCLLKLRQSLNRIAKSARQLQQTIKLFAIGDYAIKIYARGES